MTPGPESMIVSWKAIRSTPKSIESVGTLVELSTGAVAIVIGQNQVRRLLPKVIVVLDEDKNPLTDTPIKDLMMDAMEDPNNAVTIKRSLEPGSHGIDPEDFYL